MFKCDYQGCNFTHDKIQGVTGHRQSHLSDEEKEALQVKRRATIAKNKKPEVPVDELFHRVERATKILFPDPAIFYERFEEIAELRLAMFQVLKR